MSINGLGLSRSDRRLPWSDSTAFDVVLAVVLTTLAVFDAVADEVLAGEREPDAFAFALIVVAGLSLVWRRRRPLLVVGVVGAAMITFWFRQHGAFLAVLGLPSLYAVAVYEDNRRRAWIAICVASVAMMTAAGLTVLNPPTGFLFPNAITMAAYLAGTAAVGIVVRNRARIFADTQRQVERAEAERREAAALAVAEERSRIAREMHDVVAHGMSVVAVQAAAAQEIVHDRPDRAAEVMGRIEEVSRTSLTELRRMLGVLRTGDEHASASLVPQPGLSDVADVVADANAAGVVTDLTITGDRRSLAPGLELAAFRIIQESLTNVRKHAGSSASAHVSVDFGARSLRLEVISHGGGARNRADSEFGGNGLIGMRERVDIYGGTLSAGPSTGGGWAVRATLPIADIDEQPTPSERGPVMERGTR